MKTVQLWFSKTIAAAVLAVCCGSLSLHAQERLPDVRFVIDVSGSMQQSDPNDLREPALALVFKLMPDNSRAGVWTFGRWVNMAVRYEQVDRKWRRDAASAAGLIHNRGVLSNIPDALELATFDAHRLDPQYRTSVILLTDGEVEITDDPAKNAAARQRLLQGYAPYLRDKGVAVHTIALSANADQEFLAELSRITGGLALRAESAEELSAVLLQALDIAVAPEPDFQLAKVFRVDDAGQEFTVAVFMEADSGEINLLTPDLQVQSLEEHNANVSWFQGQQVELITVNQAALGEWRVTAPGAVARVDVWSGLSVAVDGPPASLTAGNRPELGVRLVDSGQAITEPALLSMLDIKVSISAAGEQGWDLDVPVSAVPASGEFRVELPMLAEPGRYEIAVNVDGPGFQRQATLVSNVVLPEPEPAPKPAPVPVPEPVTPESVSWWLPALISGLLVLALLTWWWRRRSGGDDDEGGGGNAPPDNESVEDYVVAQLGGAAAGSDPQAYLDEDADAADEDYAEEDIEELDDFEDDEELYEEDLPREEYDLEEAEDVDELDEDEEYEDGEDLEEFEYPEDGEEPGPDEDNFNREARDDVVVRAVRNRFPDPEE